MNRKADTNTGAGSDNHSGDDYLVGVDIPGLPLT